MQSKTLLGYHLIPGAVLIILGFLAFVGVVVAHRTYNSYVLPYIPAGSVSISPALPEHLVQAAKNFQRVGPEVDVPRQLFIEKLDISAPIIEVGVTKNNSIDVPTNPFEVGWFNGSALPGSWGNSILTAHYDTPTGSPALFFKLREVVPGDFVMVLSEGNVITRFQVIEKILAPVDEFPVEMLYQDETKEVLWLITCDGIWDPVRRMYTDRLIIKAETISS